MEEFKTCTKCGRSEPEVDFKGRKNTYGKFYKHPMCHECYLKTKKSRSDALFKEFGSRSHQTVIDNRPPEGTLCSCCGTPMTHGKDAYSVCFDHDPLTSIFRGLICKRCNYGLGYFNDSLDTILKAADYLKPTYETIN